MNAPTKQPHMSFADYCNMDAVNVSTLLTYGYIRNVFSIPTPSVIPAKARYAQIHGKPDTEALVVGHASHTALLEPDLFDKDYRTEPTAAQFGFGDFRKKAAKEARDEWLEEHKDAICLTAAEHELAGHVRDAVLADPEASPIFTGEGMNEVTYTWTDEETGLPCKARMDRITTYHKLPALVDLKTTKDASSWEAGKATVNYSYHIRMAWYLDCLQMVRKSSMWVLLVWVEKCEPYLVHVTQLEDDAIAEGRAQYRALMKLHAECLEAGEWAGYPAPDVIEMPPWAYRLTAKQSV